MDFASALRYAQKWVGAIPGVEAVCEGVAAGRPCITVFASSPRPAKMLPPTLGEWRVIVQGAGTNDDERGR